MTLHRKSRHNTGFSLIELIVVISIIALLVGILLPALSAAKSQTQRVRCANALRQLGVGLWSYSSDHSDVMPTYYGDDGLAFDTLAMRKPDGSAVNLGLLMGYIQSPDTFYCDAGREGASPDIALDSPANPWGNGKGSPGAWLNAGYTARFENEDDAKRHRDLDNFSNKVVYSEFLGVDGWDGGGLFSGPIFAPHRGTGYNLLFGDGGVQWVHTPAINSVRPVGKEAPDAESMQNYYLLLDVLPAGGGGQPLDGNGGDGDDEGGGDGGGDDD